MDRVMSRRDQRGPVALEPAQRSRGPATMGEAAQEFKYPLGPPPPPPGAGSRHGAGSATRWHPSPAAPERLASNEKE